MGVENSMPNENPGEGRKKRGVDDYVILGKLSQIDDNVTDANAARADANES
jgi:hypothetical protein